MSRNKRIVVLTDLHLRSDYYHGYLEAQVETLTRMVNQKPTDIVVINGDIFHKRNPRGEELLAFQTLLDSFKCSEIFVNRGNHDTTRKGDGIETTLSLFRDKAQICVDKEKIHIAGHDFHIIPHFETDQILIDHLEEASRDNANVFGHFGFDGCVSNGPYHYDSYVKKSHVRPTDQGYAFLGHIHTPKIYNDNIYLLGTQYTTTFGEANRTLYLHEIIIDSAGMHVHRNQIDFGIKHVQCSIEELPELSRKIDFNSFYTLLRLKLDHLDSFVESALKEDVFSKYNINQLEICFEDILPKFGSGHVPQGSLTNIDDDFIDQYINESDSIFSKKELLEGLNEIRSYED
jgi:DNA repair exonuclease SbcCD nuclease subunit